MTQSWIQVTTVLILFGLLLAGTVSFDLARRGLHRHPAKPHWPLGNADPGRGKVALRQYGCGACHVIPGIQGATGRVGPKLEEFVDQMFIAGVLANTPENLADWIQDPKSHHPRTAMPDLDVTEQDAWDIVAYLYGVR
jgi:cytochrome c